MRTLLLCLVVLIALPTAGVTAQENLPADKELASVIRADLQDAERLGGTSIDVRVSGNHVALVGTVNSLLDKQLATKVAKRTRGVDAVLNQLVVKRSDRSDEAIREDVLKVLRLNGATDQPEIKVSVSNGEVSMVGKVASLAEKRIAELAASGVRGARAVDNQMTVSLSDDRDERELREEINTLLVFSVFLDNVDLNVAVDGSKVSLSGTVRSAAQRDKAEQLAEVWGVRSVDVSGVRVDPDSGDPSIRKKRYSKVSDASVHHALSRSFAVDPIVFDVSTRIDIAIDDGTVTLTGYVDRLREKRKAEDLAMGVVGVTRVVNELKVQRPEKMPTNEQVIRETQEALALSPYLERRALRVHCQAAHVSLYGIVESQLEKDVAGWLAEGVTGVVHVNNSLAVEQEWEEKPDAKIKEDLDRKLKYALLDDAQQVQTQVEGGVAILRGQVDTWRQWQVAMELALEAGARHPHNLINVLYHPPHGGSRVYVPQDHRE